MEIKTFTVKDESIHSFFAQNLSGHKNPELAYSHSMYSFFEHDIFLKKEPFQGYTRVLFEIKDKARGINKGILNNYLYSIDPYDDVSVKLTLIEFVIIPLIEQ